MRRNTLIVPSIALLAGLLSHAKADITLGTAGNFAVLAGSTVTNTGPTVINGGDVGVSPGFAITGFPPGILEPPYMQYTVGAVPLTAENDLTTAYNDAAALAPTETLTGQDLGGQTLLPGVYFFASSAQLTGTLTLDDQNNPNAQFVFQIGSTLITAINAAVVTINGGSTPGSDVFWQVGSSATLGTGTAFEGHILALASITMDTGASLLDGSALAHNGAVTLASNNITNGVGSVPEPLTWNNAGGTGDGVYWDTVSQNWNNGSAPALYFDGDSVTFNDANSRNYAVTLNGTVSPGSATFSNNTGNYTLSGTGGIAGECALTVSGSGKVTISTDNSYTGGTNVNSGELVIGSASALPAKTSVTIGTASSTGTLQLATTGAAFALSGLTIHSGSTLDVESNTVMISYSGTDPASTIRAELVSGYNASGSKWAGTGITSISAAANPSDFSVGYADGGNATDRANTGVPAGEIEAMYTVAGDANLSGGVDVSDLVIVASDFGMTGADWAEGDVNYDGNVDLSDLVIVASNFGASLNSVQSADFGSSFAAEWKLAEAEVQGTDVGIPEPGAACLTMVVAAGVLARLRRSEASK
jgi:autotransporter-associated beta strand protein